MANKLRGKLPDLHRIIQLQSFLHEFHSIERVIHFSATSDRRETDTEHSYTLSIIAWYVSQYFPELDTNLCIRLALVHDLVEIYAGDTFTFGDQMMIDSKADREKEALLKLEKVWPDFNELTEDIHNYEDLKTPESNFVYVLDKIVPIIVIYLGEGRTWKEFNITLDDLKNNKKYKVLKSPQAAHYFDALVELLKDKPELFPK